MMPRSLPPCGSAMKRLLHRRHYSAASAAENRFDVTIIGGGAIGAAVADALLALDEKLRVCIVERDPTFSIASSVLSLGSIRAQFSQAVNIEISLKGVDFIRELSRDEDNDVQFDEGGYLFLASKDGAGVETLRTNVALQQSLGADVRLLGGGTQLSKRYPWMRTDDIGESSLGVSGEGWFDPYTLTMALRRRAKEKGAVMKHGEVAKLSRSAQRIFLSGSSDDIVETGVVVNAAGCWSSEVLAMVDGVGKDKAFAALPVVPRKRNVFAVHCPELLDPPVPLTVCPSGVYIRREGSPEKGLFLCGGMEGVASADPNMQGIAEELAVDHDFFESAIWPSIANRIPALENAKVKSSWAGFYDYNVFDQNGLLGKPAVHDGLNMLCATGFSGHGIQQAPAVGAGIAELIVHGEYRSLGLLADLNATRVAEGRALVEKNIV